MQDFAEEEEKKREQEEKKKAEEAEKEAKRKEKEEKKKEKEEAEEKWKEFWVWKYRPIREGDSWTPNDEENYFTL